MLFPLTVNDPDWEPLLSVKVFPEIPKLDNDGVVGVPEVK